MLNLFYRKQPIDQIQRSTWSELKQWNEFHDIIVRADKDAAKAAKRK